MYNAKLPLFNLRSPASSIITMSFLYALSQVLKRSEVMERHQALIQENQHIRFMWMPSMDAVVVVTCNPLPLDDRERADLEEKAEKIALDKDIEVRTTLRLRELLAQAQK